MMNREDFIKYVQKAIEDLRKNAPAGVGVTFEEANISPAIHVLGSQDPVAVDLTARIKIEMRQQWKIETNDPA